MTEEEEGEGDNMKNSNSSEQLDADGDTASEVSSEVSFSYEFAQTEVMMKALGSNGTSKKKNEQCARAVSEKDLNLELLPGYGEPVSIVASDSSFWLTGFGLQIVV